MAQTLKALKITVLVDAKGAVKGIKTAKGEVLGLGTEADKAGRRSKGLGSVFKGIGPLMIGSGAAIAGVTMILKKSITAAGDSVEVWSKFDAVFKEHSETATKWVTEFGGAIGRSRTDIAEWASILQDTFVPMGLARGHAADLSMELVELAVDVASFNNQMDATVIRDFQSALVGNHETLRKYGIVITETTLKQEAINSRIWDGVGMMTEQEKIQARLNLIYAGTADAQGDALRTSDSFNNSIKALNAAMHDLYVEMGERIIPAAGKLVQSVTRFIRSLDIDRIYAGVTAVGLLTTGFVAYRTAVTLATVTTVSFTRAMGKTGLGLAFVVAGTALTILIEKMGLFGVELIKVGLELKEQTLITYVKELEILNTKVSDGIRLTEEERERRGELKELISELRLEIVGLTGEQENLNAATEQGTETIREHVTWLAAWYAKSRLIATEGLPDISDAMRDTEARMKTLGKAKEKDTQLSIEGAIAVGASAASIGGAIRTMIKQQLALSLANMLRSIFSTIPFPFNIAAAGIGAAAVSMLFDKIIPAAKGMDEMVTKPTVILAGEAGPERVKITPGGRPGGGIVFAPQYHFHGIVDSEMVRERVAPRLEEDARRLLNKLQLAT